jgi:hypothetical protein
VAEHLTPDEVSAVYGCLEGRLGIGVLHDSDGWTDPERRAFWSALRKLVHMYGPDETLVSLVSIRRQRSGPTVTATQTSRTRRRSS